MEKRRKRLDSLFEIALVLLGILSAAEFQYFLTTEEETLHFYALRVFTIPFLLLISVWLLKELFADIVKMEQTMLMTEFCWNFWCFMLFYYLLGIYGGFPFGIYSSFAISIIMIIILGWAYKRAAPANMRKYYKSFRWRALRLTVFVGAYLILILLVWPHT